MTVYRPKLMRRLITLQNKLKSLGHELADLPTTDILVLGKAPEVLVCGERVDKVLVADHVLNTGSVAVGTKRRKVEVDDKQMKLPFEFIAPQVPGKGKQKAVEEVRLPLCSEMMALMVILGEAPDWEVYLAGTR